MIFRNKGIVLFIMAMLLINGCISISQSQAEARAVQFVNKNVRFFAREENSTIKLPQYRVSEVSSYRENQNWVVVMHVSASVGNETKKNDVVIKLANNGDLIEFNGKKVPR